MKKQRIAAVCTALLLGISVCSGTEAASISASAAVSVYGTITEGGITYQCYSSYAEITDCETSIETAVIPESISGVPVTAIGKYAFFGCTALRSITLPDTLTTIESRAFENCTALESLVIPEGTRSIGEMAFTRCSSLVRIHIPAAVQSMGKMVFYQASALQEITVAEENTAFSAENGILLNQEKTELLCCPDDCRSESLVIPTSVRKLHDYACYGCHNLRTVTIQGQLSELGQNTFAQCSALERITLTGEITEIPYMCFYGCKSLQTITIPNGTEQIGYMAFCGCSSMTSLQIPGSVKSVEGYAFSGCPSLSDVYYNGSDPAWSSMKIASGNSALSKAALHFGYVMMPTVSRYSLGNVNGDGMVDALDAAVLLTAAASVGAGDASGLTLAEELAADVNDDGLFNAEDAAYILEYAAAFGTGLTQSLSEFMGITDGMSDEKTRN